MYTGFSNQLITWLMVVNQMLPYISFAYTLQPQQQKIHYIMIVNGNVEIVTILRKVVLKGIDLNIN